MAWIVAYRAGPTGPYFYRVPPGSRGHNNPLAAIRYDHETATRIAADLSRLYASSGGRAKVMTAPKVPAHVLARTRENPMRKSKSPAAQKTYLVTWEDWNTGTPMKSRVKADSVKAAASKIAFFDPQTQQRILSVRLVKPRKTRAMRSNPSKDRAAKPRHTGDTSFAPNGVMVPDHVEACIDDGEWLLLKDRSEICPRCSRKNRRLILSLTRKSVRGTVSPTAVVGSMRPDAEDLRCANCGDDGYAAAER